MSNSPQIKHHGIAEDLRTKITEGKIRDRLPPQPELAKQYSVHSITMGKALKTLVEEGLLYRIPGQGTFVSEHHLTNTVAVVLSTLESPLHERIIAGAEEGASKNHNDLLVRAHKGDEKLEREIIIDLLENHKVDGFLIWPSRRDEFSPAITILTEKRVPFVAIRYSPTFVSGAKFSYVVNDDNAGSFLAAKHLVNRGHREIGFLAPYAKPDTFASVVEDRRQNFNSALEGLGLEPARQIIVDWMNNGWANGNGLGDFRSQLNGITGVFCFHDLLAANCIRSVERLGIRIPEDLSLIGYDDLDIAKYFDLTTVRQPMDQVGAKSVEALLAEIEGKRKNPKQVTVKPELVERGSVRPV